MKKISIIIISSLILLVTAFFLFAHFSKNQLEARFSAIEKEMLTAEVDLLEDQIPALTSEFIKIQKDSNLHHERIVNSIIETPFIPTADYQDFRNNFLYTYQTRIIAVEGITGAGKTTFCDKVGMLIAADSSRLLKAMCVPNNDVEMHKLWIGTYERGVFYPGKFLKFIEQATLDSLHNYVFIIEDFDKISPQTFLGAEIWSELDNPIYTTAIDGYTKNFVIPENLFIISNYQTGISATNEFGLEEIRRLSRATPLQFYNNSKEFFLYLNQKYHFKSCGIDTLHHLRNVLYFYEKANELIEKKYGISYTIGQWSNVRKVTDIDEFEDYVKTFVSHVNSFKPAQELHLEDFNEILFTLQSEGEIYHSNFVYRGVQTLMQTGLFSEISVGVLFALATGLGGLFLYRKRKSFIKKLLLQFSQYAIEYENGTINYATAKGHLLKMSDEIESLLLSDKINFQEANYLVSIQRDYMERLEINARMENRSAELKKMMELFMKDGQLETDERDKLILYLEGIRETLTANDYDLLKQQIDNTYYKTNL